MERLVLFPGSYFCDTLTFSICLYFLKSYIIAEGCYIFRICVKNFFSILIKFLFCKRLGWSATERDGQTSPEKKLYMLIKREYFRFFKTSQNIGWNRLNLWKELKQANRVLDLGLETTLLKFTQRCPRRLCQKLKPFHKKYYEINNRITKYSNQAFSQASVCLISQAGPLSHCSLNTTCCGSWVTSPPL